MKKALSLLLALVLCLSLCACGNGENGNNQGGVNNNTTTSTTPPSSTQTEPEESETVEAEPQYEVVEITLDNWREYFEIVPTYLYVKNAFGEFSFLVSMYELVICEEYICDINKSDVAIEFTYTYGSAPYTIDFENRTITYGEVTNISTSSSRTKKFGEISTYAGDRDENKTLVRYGFDISDEYLYDLQGTNNSVVVDVDISRVSGSLYIYQKD